MERLGLDDPRCADVDEREIGGKASGKSSGIEAQQISRNVGHGAQQTHERQVAVVNQRKCGGQQRFEADGTEGRLRERMAFDFGVLRIVA